MRINLEKLINSRILKKSKLTLKQEVLLKLMKDDNFNSKSPFKPTAYWERISMAFDKRLKLEGIQIPEEQYFNTQFSQSNFSKITYYRYALWMLFLSIKKRGGQKLLKKIKPSVDDSSAYVFEFEGVRVTWDILISLDSLLSIQEVYKDIFTKKVIVADLGAGWGRIGYALKQINPKCSYIAIDLPEPLLISSERLPQLLPNEEVFDYKYIKELTSIGINQLKKGGLWFCGTQDINKFEDGSIDIFINVASFQEMTKTQVNSYLKIIDKKVKGIFYSQQYWQNKELKKNYNVVGEINEYNYPKNWKKRFLRNSTFSERYFEAAFLID